MIGLWIFLGGAVGLILGAVTGFLLAERRCARDGDEVRRQVIELGAKLDAASACVAERDVQLREARDQREALRQSNIELHTRAERLDAQLEAERRNLLQQKQLLEDAQAKLKDVFAGVSREALHRNNEAFLELANSRLEPMKGLMENYQKRLAEIEQSRVRTYSDIREQLGSVAETHRALSTQTSQLVTALSNPGTRGRWGEIGLERVLEFAGMTPGIHFDAQPTVSDGDGRVRPDVRVNLPGGKCIIIDSKYPGTHFFQALECEDAAQREGLLKQYAQAVRGHASALRSRDYWRRVEGSPEYVVMFLTGEAMVYAAVQVDPSLLDDMFRDRVIIATPTTLVALLKAVAYGWQQAEVEKNIREVRELGGEIVERVAIFANHFQRVGQCLDNATQSYNQATGSLESRLLVSARKMAELGVRGREIPEVQPVDTATRRLSAVASGGEGAGGDGEMFS